MARPKRWKNCMSENLLTMLTVIGVFGGVALGLILRASKEPGGWTKREVMYINFPGEVFLNMLKALILPLILASIVSAIGNLDLGLSGKIGARSIYYYGTTTITAVILGIILVTTIRPGVGSDKNLRVDEDQVPQRNSTTADTILDLIRNIFPPNLIQACIQQYKTVLVEPAKKDEIASALDANATLTNVTEAISHVSREVVEALNETLNATNDEEEPDFYTWKITHQWGDGTNTLGIVIFGIVLGITVGKMGESGKPLLDFFNALSDAMMIITNWVIWLSPIGVTFLVAANLLEIKDFASLVGRLGLYFITVLLGLFIHGFGTLTVIYYVCTRTLPFRVIGKLSQVMVTAFGTASSSATLPITLQCLDSMGNDPRITRFVVPIGATINMDGTALYEAVAAIFIAQVRGIDLSFSQIISVSLTATAASIGAAGIPQAGLVTMVMVLNTVNLPARDVSLIIAVDWLLDRFRTTINVMCDALGACIIEHMSRGELDDETGRELEEAVELAHLRKAES